MDNFVFQNTTRIYFGDNQLENLPKEIKEYGRRVLLTYGGGSIKRSGLYTKIIDILKKEDIEVFELAGIEPNPRHTTVNKGASICREEKIDVILAVGGGSTIDCSKVIATATFYEGDSWDLVTRKVEPKKALPLISVLTLSATGSEMNSGAVITNLDTDEKIGVLHPLQQPKTSFLDPRLTYTVNKYQTAAGSADILSHIFDIYYFTTEKKMEMIDNVMEVLIRSVIKYAPIALKEPDNYEARANLMWASSWALNNFIEDGILLDASCHMMEHELSAFYDITHGHGLAILTPRWLTYCLDEKTAPVIKKFGVDVFNIDASLSPNEGAKKAIEELSDFLFNKLELQSHLSDLGIDETNFEKMAYKACRGKSIKGFKELFPEDVVKIFKMCL